YGRCTGVDNIKGFIEYTDSLNPYVYVYNQLKNYVDEDGNVPVVVGAFLIGDEIGIGKQIITDVAVSAINKKVINLFWERYIGSTVGGVVGVGTGLVASPVVI